MTTMKDMIRDFGAECMRISEEIEHEVMDLTHDENGELIGTGIINIKNMEEERFMQLLDELMEELKKFYE